MVKKKIIKIKKFNKKILYKYKTLKNKIYKKKNNNLTVWKMVLMN